MLTAIQTSPLSSEPADDRPVTVIDVPAPRPSPAATTALSRVRGGTYSSTVDVVRFADATTARTDLIRLTPNIDAYSLDFAGTSPRHLSHYRDVPWSQAGAGLRWRREITAILTNGFPHVSVTELSRRLVEAGYPVGSTVIRQHEAIAATQVAIWSLTNGLRLDTRPLDVPVRAASRIGEHPSSRRVSPDPSGRLDWHTLIPAGQTVYLDLEFAERPQLGALHFRIGPRTGRHPVAVRLERSVDAMTWQPVSGTAMVLPAGRSAGRQIRRGIGAGATLSSAGPSGQVGHRHYRLAVNGPTDRDGLLDLRDVHLEPLGGPRYANNVRIVSLYDHLLSRATGAAPSVRTVPPDSYSSHHLGPFTLTRTAFVRASGARVVDAGGDELVGPLTPGTTFYVLPRSVTAADHLELWLQPTALTARVLIGSRSAGGPGVFTPLVSLTSLCDPRVEQRVRVTPAT